MLKQQGPRDLVPVFGKPWFWQRSSSAMESSRGLAQVFIEMREEIHKLEEENRELRGSSIQPALGSRSERKEHVEKIENPYLNLRRNVSAPVLEGKNKVNTVMTVRRYSTGSNLSGLTARKTSIDSDSHSFSRWQRLQEDIQQRTDVYGSPSRAEVQRANNRHSLQAYIHQNRAKVKTVTFLLPVDDIYTSRPALVKHQEEAKLTHLSSIMETDS